MGDMGCERLREVAAELALGVLYGHERAEALAHVNRCDLCREHVRTLTLTGDALLGLVPAAEPPIGFEDRVMARLDLKPRTGWHRRWVPITVAAAVAAVVFGLGGWGVSQLTGPTQPTQIAVGNTGAPLLTADLMTSSHEKIGLVFGYAGKPPWLYMAVDTELGSGTVSCQLEGRDGSIIRVGSFQVTDGYGHWGAPSPVDPSTVAGARLVLANGTVLASGTFVSRR